MSGRRAGLVVALVAAVGVLVGSIGYAAATANNVGGGASRLGPGTMMGGTTAGAGSTLTVGMGPLWLAGDGNEVGSIAAARARAAAAASAGLHPGEVIWFDNGFYVELKDNSGRAATEVLVNPVDGSVRTEPGPAMMWNSRYGMHAVGSGSQDVSESQAKTIAQQWLDANQPGATVLSLDSYPGYYTADVGRSGIISGMLSVNATSGQVWFHSWHGAFIAREDV